MPSAVTRFQHRSRAFVRREDGSLVSFSLYIFLAMLMFGGIALDLMLVENDRVHAQNCSDRATLAAANLDQTVDPKVVVKDYMAKCGITVKDEDITVTEAGIAPIITGRQVSIDISADYNTILMNLVGVEQLPFGAMSEATEAVNDIEVSLILDVSGSMGSNNKLENMQSAAKDFVSKVLDGQDGRVSMSLVPYSTQVSAGESLFDVMNVNDWHNSSHCVHFDTADFSTTAIDHSSALTQSAHFDAFKSYNQSKTPTRPVCGTDSYFHINPWTNSIAALHAQIDDFEADGNTSIDVAMKWGTALLDPSMRTVNAARLVADASLSTDFIDRPYDHDRPDTLKFVILMTDGINTRQYRLRSAFASGQSPVYKHPTRSEYAEYDAGEGKYYFEEWNTWSSSLPTGWTQLSWPQVWSQMSMRWRAFHLHYRRDNDADDYYDTYYDPLWFVYQSTKNSLLNSMCTAAKDQGIVIFTVGFEVTDASAAIMKNCASTPSHFYRVEGLDIEVAFASIANQINQLKLTQ